MKPFPLPTFERLEEMRKPFADKQIENGNYYFAAGKKFPSIAYTSNMHLTKDREHCILNLYNVLGSFTSEQTCLYIVRLDLNTMDYVVKNGMGYGSFTYMRELPEGKKMTRTRAELNNEQQIEMDAMIATSLMYGCYDLGKPIYNDYCKMGEFFPFIHKDEFEI